MEGNHKHNKDIASDMYANSALWMMIGCLGLLVYRKILNRGLPAGDLLFILFLGVGVNKLSYWKRKNQTKELLLGLCGILIALFSLAAHILGLYRYYLI